MFLNNEMIGIDNSSKRIQYEYDDRGRSTKRNKKAYNCIIFFGDLQIVVPWLLIYLFNLSSLAERRSSNGIMFFKGLLENIIVSSVLIPLLHFQVLKLISRSTASF